MPPSERVRKHIMNWHRSRDSHPNMVFSGIDLEGDNNSENGSNNNVDERFPVFDDLVVEEFDGVEKILEWNKIERLFFKETKSLKFLPTLPTHLEYLDLTDTGIEELPTLPKTIKQLSLYNNENITLPPSLPDGLERITFVENKLKELPSMPNVGYYFINIKEANLKEPFRSIYNRWKAPAVKGKRNKEADKTAKTHKFFEDIREAWEQRKRNERARGRNTIASMLVLNRNERFPEGPSSLISEFISGKKGTAKQQLKKLEANYKKLTQKGGKPKKNTTRRM